MTDAAYQIWEAFKEELKYIGITEKNILELADELEAL